MLPPLRSSPVLPLQPSPPRLPLCGDRARHTTALTAPPLLGGGEAAQAHYLVAVGCVSNTLRSLKSRIPVKVEH